ncbi:MAG: TPM domain-containing protein, partial [Candidatus Acidiferrales bacterium]
MAKALRPFLLLALLSVSVGAEKAGQLEATGYVNDFAGVLDAGARSRITALCQEVDQKTQAQIAVVTIRTLEGSAASDFGNRLFERWGIGRKPEDRGVLILLAIEERQYWTEVGYGLEPILPDGKVGGFGREMVPLLRRGDYGGALFAVTSRVAEVIAEDRGVQLGSDRAARRDTRSDGSGRPGIGTLITLLFFLLFFGGGLMRMLGIFGLWGMGRGRGGGHRGGWAGGWGGGGGERWGG